MSKILIILLVLTDLVYSQDTNISISNNFVLELTNCSEYSYPYNYIFYHNTIGIKREKTFFDRFIFDTDFIQFVQLIYIVKMDVYDFTKYGIENNIGSEANDLAEMFTSKGKYDELFLVSQSLNILAYFGSALWENSLYNSFFRNNEEKTTNLQTISTLRTFRILYLTAWNIAEFLACRTWIEYKHIKKPVKVCFYIQF